MVDLSQYAIAIIPLDAEDGGGFLGILPDFQGCISDGDTRQEALENTLDAAREWIDAQQSRGEPIPEPGTSAQYAREREKKLLDAISALVEYRDEADGKIASLERKLTELIAVLQVEPDRLPSSFSFASLGRSTRAKRAH